MRKRKSRYAIDECALKNLLKVLPKDKFLNDKSKVFHALSEPIRIKILNALLIRPLCVCVLTEITKMRYSKLSYHLSILKENNLVNCREDGNWIIYNITEQGKKVIKLLQAL